MATSELCTIEQTLALGIVTIMLWFDGALAPMSLVE